MDEIGYIPEAVINWIGLMGGRYDDKTDFFTLEDLVEKFSLEKLNPSPAAINFSKLDHFNGLHIRNMDVADFAKRIQPWFEKAGIKPEPNVLLLVAAAIQDRTKKLTEVVSMAGFFFRDEVELEPARIVSDKMDSKQALEAARYILAIFENLAEINQENAETPLRELAVEMELKAGQIFGLLRETLTGQQISPPIFDIIPILGREKVLALLQGAQEVLAELDNK
ncbi:MAG: hypothetical protein HQ574_05090 [Chloroflexi bacterium]|nr:hypothetical protein [Chloroflexota bacterium]